jgi:hypothetical protein
LLFAWTVADSPTLRRGELAMGQLASVKIIALFPAIWWPGITDIKAMIFGVFRPLPG